MSNEYREIDAGDNLVMVFTEESHVMLPKDEVENEEEVTDEQE